MLYLHIPFCKNRCIYCSFFSSIDFKKKQEYISSVCLEIELQHKYLSNSCLDSIYFGGGTPSVLEYADFEKIFSTILRYFTITGNTEITIECNPDDVSDKFVAELKRLPFNRISLGVQSLDDSELRFLNRRHNSKQAIEAVKKLQSAGYNNISVDLIYSLPMQTLDSWKSTLESTLSLDIRHISAYTLSYEKGTKMYDLLRQRTIEELDENTTEILYNTLTEYLALHGFEHYEISNFCKQGFRSRHNSGYWNSKHYLGIGAAAHSYNGVSRRWNISDINKYCKGVWNNAQVSNIETLTEIERYNEFVFLSLRTSSGINLQKLLELFGKASVDYCTRVARKYEKLGLIEIDSGKIRFCSKGFFVSDGIMSDFCR